MMGSRYVQYTMCPPTIKWRAHFTTEDCSDGPKGTCNVTQEVCRPVQYIYGTVFVDSGPP